jgi:hypothetical protein
VWFHADKLSSAHIYLRMNEGEAWDSIPEELVIDCAQLTKANSIEGSTDIRFISLVMMTFQIRKQEG